MNQRRPAIAVSRWGDPPRQGAAAIYDRLGGVTGTGTPEVGPL
jgi:hypothetical protein